MTDSTTGEIKKIYSAHNVVLSTANPKHMLVAHDKVTVTAQAKVGEMTMV